MYNSKRDYQRLVNQEMKRLNDQFDTQADFDEDSHDSFADVLIPTDKSLTEKLQKWYKQFNPPAECTNAVLQILIDEGLDVPRSTQALVGKRVKQSDEAVNMDDSHNHDDGFHNFQDFDNSSSWPAGVRNVKKENFKEKDKDVITEIQEQQKQMKLKLNRMMREIARVNVKLDESVGNIARSTSEFPIENVTDLTAFENALNDQNTGSYVISIKRIINSESINKSLDRILSREILLEHNLDGRQKKLALNVYPKLLDILFRAYEGYESFPEFTWDLKQAMKRVKNRFHKANCMNRKSVSSAKSDPLLVNAKAAKTGQDEDYYY